LTTAVGQPRSNAKGPTFLDVPNLVVTIQESAADDLIAWYEDFLIKGSNGPEQQKGGLLQFLAVRPSHFEISASSGWRTRAWMQVRQTCAGCAPNCICEKLSLQYPATDDSSKT
jgi:hypothetical protein